MVSRLCTWQLNAYLWNRIVRHRMTLRELIQSVDSEQYSDSALYQKLLDTKPEYGSNRRIQVKLVNDEIAITRSTFGRFACKECSRWFFGWHSDLSHWRWTRFEYLKNPTSRCHSSWIVIQRLQWFRRVSLLGWLRQPSKSKDYQIVWFIWQA